MNQRKTGCALSNIFLILLAIKGFSVFNKYLNQSRHEAVQPIAAFVPTGLPETSQKFVTHAHRALTVSYPSNWQIETDELDFLEFVSAYQRVSIRWQDFGFNVAGFLSDGKEAKALMDKMSLEREAALHEVIEADGFTILSSKPLDQQTIGSFSVIGGKAFVVSALLDESPDLPATQFIVADVVCGIERTCVLGYTKWGQPSINQEDWTLLDEIVESVRFTEQ